MRRTFSLALSTLCLSLIMAGCADQSSSTNTHISDARVSPDVVAGDDTCKPTLSDYFALVMVQQYLHGRGTDLPTTTVAPEPDSAWVQYNPRAYQGPQFRARGYLLSACGVLSRMQQRTWGEGFFAYTFWRLPLSRETGTSSSSLLTSSWNLRDERTYVLTSLTAGGRNEIREGSDAATTIGTLSVTDSLGRAATFDETWWLMCVRRGTSPDSVRLPQAWRPIAWRDGQIGRCTNEDGL